MLPANLNSNCYLRSNCENSMVKLDGRCSLGAGRAGAWWRLSGRLIGTKSKHVVGKIILVFEEIEPESNLGGNIGGSYSGRRMRDVRVMERKDDDEMEKAEREICALFIVITSAYCHLALLWTSGSSFTILLCPPLACQHLLTWHRDHHRRPLVLAVWVF